MLAKRASLGMPVATNRCQRLALAAVSDHPVLLIDGCDKVKQLRGTLVDIGHFHYLHKLRRWSLRLACSQTANSGPKIPKPSCTLDSRSAIWASEQHSRRLPSCAPTQSVLSRSSRSCDPASFRWHSNSSPSDSSSGSKCSKVSSQSISEAKYTDGPGILATQNGRKFSNE